MQSSKSQMRRTLVIGRKLKSQFRKRCESLNMHMSDVLTALIFGWEMEQYQIEVPDPVSETLYVPSPAYGVLRAGADAAPARTSMRFVLEQLIVGWLDGRYRPRMVAAPPEANNGEAAGE